MKRLKDKENQEEIHQLASFPEFNPNLIAVIDLVKFKKSLTRRKR